MDADADVDREARVGVRGIGCISGDSKPACDGTARVGEDDVEGVALRANLGAVVLLDRDADERAVAVEEGCRSIRTALFEERGVAAEISEQEPSGRTTPVRRTRPGHAGIHGRIMAAVVKRTPKPRVSTDPQLEPTISSIAWP